MSRGIRFGFTIGAGLILSGALGLAGCGDDSNQPGTGGTGGTGGAGGAVVGGGGEGAGGTGGIGGTGGGDVGDGNDSFDTATTVAVGDLVDAALDPVDSDVDFYTFTATAGQLVGFIVDAKPDETPFAEGFVDTALTLYDASQTQIAYNDDPFPRFTQDSLLMTRLPTDGVYYFKVEAWCAEPGSGCYANWHEDVTDISYRVAVGELDPSIDGFVAEVEPNDTAAQATPMEFPPGPEGEYFAEFTYNFGALEDAGIDVFSFVVPTQTEYSGFEPSIVIAAHPTGGDGNGSSADIASAWIVHAATHELVARVEHPQAAQWLAPRITPGDTYHLFVEGPAGGLGDNPFYFLFDTPALGGILEQDDVGNDTVPEPFAATPVPGNPPEITSWVIGGDIGTLNDIDHFELTVPDPLPASGEFSCAAQTEGSGLRMFHAALLRGSDMTVLKEDTETTAERAIGSFTPPVDETTWVFQVMAPAIDANNPTTYYICEVYVL